jgi:enamine deaminase RidA (YjgF/YER057c/UK114 family)
MTTATVSAEARLRELGMTLPPVRATAGTFVNAVRAGEWLYLSGHAPITGDGRVVFGRLGADLDVEAGYAAARVSALAALASMREELGSLDLVERIVRVNGVVNATAEFRQHTQVINGASDLIVEVFGERGQHTRLAVGVASLPFNICLEVDLVALVRS